MGERSTWSAMWKGVQTSLRPLRWLDEQVDSEERRLVVQAVVVGLVVWAFTASLKWAVHHGIALLSSLLARGGSVLFVWPALFVGSALVALLVRVRSTTIQYRDQQGRLHPLEGVEGDGLERAIALYFASEPALERALVGEQGVAARWRMPTFSLALRKMLASWLTLSSGGAGGLEASVTLVGECTAAGLFKPRVLPRAVPHALRRGFTWVDRVLEWWRTSQPEDLQAAQLCGIAAAIATLLGTPFAAAFFAIEVIYRRRPIVDRLMYALISALIAFFLNHLVTGAHSPFPAVVSHPPLYVGRYYIALFAVAASMGILSSGFRYVRAWADRSFHKYARAGWQRHLTGAFVTGAFAVAAVFGMRALDLPLPSHAAGEQAVWLVLGPGENVIHAALNGEFTLPVAAIVLGARFGATVSTIGSGGSAGLLFPTLCFGCLVAAGWAELFDVETAWLAIPAMTASLASVANVQLAAILLVVEGFGAPWIVPAMFALVVASIFAHKNSIYRAQRESFDPGQILPGVSVRRIRVAGVWAGKDLRSLGVRERFGLTVIGMVDRREGPEGLEEHVLLNPPPDKLLTRGDLLIVLGEDERLERFERASADATLTGHPAYRP
jgi:CIC family chloride channel protein